MPVNDSLSAGRLDKQVVIQRRDESDDGGGGQTIAWSDFITVRAAIEPGTGREFMLAQQLEPEITHTVTIRYRATVTAKHRFVYQGRTFPIHVMNDPLERHEQWICYCSEVAQT